MLPLGGNEIFCAYNCMNLARYFAFILFVSVVDCNKKIEILIVTAK